MLQQLRNLDLNIALEWFSFKLPNDPKLKTLKNVQFFLVSVNCEIRECFKLFLSGMRFLALIFLLIKKVSLHFILYRVFYFNRYELCLTLVRLDNDLPLSSLLRKMTDDLLNWIQCNHFILCWQKIHRVCLDHITKYMSN